MYLVITWYVSLNEHEKEYEANLDIMKLNAQQFLKNTKRTGKPVYPPQESYSKFPVTSRMDEEGL
jgi:hypothetical protein